MAGIAVPVSVFPLKSEVAGLLLIDRAKSICDFEFRLFRRTGSANLTFWRKKAVFFLYFFHRRRSGPPRNVSCSCPPSKATTISGSPLRASRSAIRGYAHNCHRIFRVRLSTISSRAMAVLGTFDRHGVSPEGFAIG